MNKVPYQRTLPSYEIPKLNYRLIWNKDAQLYNIYYRDSETYLAYLNEQQAEMLLEHFEHNII